MGATDTTTLITVQSQIKPIPMFILDTFFTRQVNFESDTIAFDELETEERMTPFVSPMVQGKVQKQLGSVLKSFKPGYLKPKDVVDPNRALSRIPGEALQGSLTGAQRIQAIKTDLLASQKGRIGRTLENMAVRGMLDGKVTVKGTDFPEMVIDFGRNANNTLTLTGSDVWTDAAATPLDDLQAIYDELDSPPTDVVMNNKGYGKFIKHQAVRDAINTDFAGNRSQLSLGAGDGKEVQLKGQIDGVNIWVYTAGYKDDAGVKHKYISDNEVLVTSTACDGVRAFAAILDPRAGYQALDMFPKNWISEDPAAEYIMTQSAPAMLVGNTNATGKIIMG